MKKITYISLLFFFTSIFYLFMWFSGLKNTFADTEIQVKPMTPYIGWIHIWEQWLYNSNYYWFSPSSSSTVNYVNIVDKTGSGVLSYLCNVWRSTPWSCNYTAIEFEKYYILFANWVNSRSSGTLRDYRRHSTVLIIDKKTWLYKLYTKSKSDTRQTYATIPVIPTSFYFSNWFFYFLLDDVYHRFNPSINNIVDNQLIIEENITNPNFTFYSVMDKKENIFYNKLNNVFYVHNKKDIGTITFTLGVYWVNTYNINNTFTSFVSSKALLYWEDLYISQEDNGKNIQTFICDVSSMNCSVVNNEYSLYFNPISWKWYRIIKSDYDTFQISNLYSYYWFYNDETSSFWSWYIKTDNKLYISSSYLNYFWSGNSSWWGSWTCTQNNDNCTCISYTPQTYENQLKYDYSVYWKNPNDYIISNSDSSYFRFRKTSMPNNTLDFTFWDFDTKNFYNSWWLAIFDDNEKYISFIDWGINLNNWYFEKNELNIKNYSWSINFIQLDSLQDYNFNLYWLNQKWEKELIWNFKTNTPNHLQNTYFNFSIEFDWYQYWWYSIKDIILKQYERVYWEDQLICYNSQNKNFTIDWEDTDYTIIDNLDPNIIKDIIEWNTQSVFKDKIFNEIESSINSQSLWNLDVSWSWIINSTMWTSLNTIHVWDFWVWSCRMFWDNLQFLYYSNWQISPNVSFWDFDNMFLDSLSFLWEKMIWVLIAPLNNTFALVTIITPFWSSNKDYCLLGNVVTYQPHKMFIWTPYHNKMLLIDYLILFAYWLFLWGMILAMNWVSMIALPEAETRYTQETEEHKNIDWKSVIVKTIKNVTKTPVSKSRKWRFGDHITPTNDGKYVSSNIRNHKKTYNYK